MNRIFLSSCLFFVLACSTQPASAAEVGVGVVFSENEIAIIGAWYQDHEHEHKHGKGGKKAKRLPPGIAKNLARGKPLPPGIAKQVLPGGLQEMLPPPPRGYERIIVDGKVLLVEIATRVIHDVLMDVVFH
jgi:Ni/Co efflux regulator RcnB